MSRKLCSLAAAVLALAAAPALAQVKVDEKYPEYTPVAGVSGNVKSVGSDSMNNLMTLWAEGFIKEYPNVRVEIEGKGSATAPPALIEGTATFGPMSRPMKADEIDKFEKKFGYKPLALSTSIDMLAVYVHKDNPLREISLQQVDAIFSKARKLGGKADVTTWGQLGLKGDLARQPISLYGRNSASGTYGYFKEHALGKGDFKDSVKEQPGTSAVVQGVASDKTGIGYGGIGYKTADVGALALSNLPGEPAISATVENAYTGEYPLARFLLIYVNAKPGAELDPLRREFIKYVFSKQGQQIVVKDGYFPVPWTVAQRTLTELGIVP